MKKPFQKPFLLIFAIAAFFGFAACENNETGLSQAQKDDAIIAEYLADNDIKDFKKTSRGLYYTDLAEGAGSLYIPGDTAIVHYTGWELYGKVFDSSEYRGETFTFAVGVSGVIDGWQEAISLMKVLDKKRFYIPSGLAYGPNGSGSSIPPNAILVFDILAVGRKRK